MLPVSCPHCGKDILERNKTLVQVRELLRKTGHDSSLRLYLDKEAESNLGTVRPVDVGNEIVGVVATQGPRVAFKTLYGFETVWDQDRLELKP